MRTREQILNELTEKNVGLNIVELLLDIRMQNEQILEQLKDINRSGVKTHF